MRSTIALTVLLAAYAGSLCSQSLDAPPLGDLARQEEARRKGIATPAKVYTNDSLQAVPPLAAKSTADPPAGTPALVPSTPSPASGSQTPGQPSSKPASAAEPAEAKTESYWHTRIAAAREGRVRSEILADALQSRINALNTDFANRDDPAQRGQIAVDRQKALVELDRMKTEVQQYKKAILDIEEAARRAGIPPGWLR